MSYVPGCSADAFISYAHHDNRDGWVTQLKKRLTEKLNPFMSGRAEVWFDDRIAPGVYFKEEIQKKLKDAQIFIAVVSPSYLNSEFSITHELDWFQNQGGREIIQLLKVPLEKDQDVPLPESAYKVLHDERDGHLLENEYLDRVLDEVVATMKDKLREAWEIRPKIYMAQLRNEDVKPQWEELKERLHGEGYAVVPKGILPVRVPDARIREWVEAARLSLHLEGLSNDPLAQRQLQIAKQSGLPTVILTVPPRKGQLSAIVDEVQSKLESQRKPAVYLIYDYYSDHTKVSAFPEFIRRKTYCDVFLPEAGEKYHKFRLQASDGVLLFRGEAPEEWLKSQEESLLQAAARRGNRPTAEAKYFTRTANGHSPSVRVTHGSRHELIIERTGEVNVNDLQPFFDALHISRNVAGGTV